MTLTIEQLIYAALAVAALTFAIAATIFYSMGRDDGQRLGRWVEEPYKWLQEDYLTAHKDFQVKRVDFKLGYMMAAVRFARVPLRNASLQHNIADDLENDHARS